MDNHTDRFNPTNKKRQMKTYDNSDWKAVGTGGTVKIASRGNFGLYDSIPRGTALEVSKACDAYCKKKGIVYGSSWFSRQKEQGKGNQ